MSEILNLAKQFETTSKQQAAATETSVKIEFQQHENAIRQALKSNEQSINNAIREQNQRQRWLLVTMMGKLSLWIGLSGLCLIAILSGILVYQGKMIADRYQEIQQLDQSVLEMNEYTGKGLSVLMDDKKKNQYYLILPKSAYNVGTPYQSKNGHIVIKYQTK
ncbi:MbeB family mobilization protein [Proteus mirabilis]|uniref:MbeB family mobilization protein n=1 Tax=Proteus mirabilis TaxID=584 RepID=UPI003C6E455E